MKLRNNRMPRRHLAAPSAAMAGAGATRARASRCAAARLRDGALLALIIGAAASCSDPARTSSPSSQSASAAGVAAPASADARPDGVSAGLWEALVELSKRCKLDTKESTVNCKGGQLDTLSAQLAKGDGITGSELLTTLSAALRQGELPLQTLTANVIERALAKGFGGSSKPPGIDPEQARVVLEAVGALPTAQALQAMPLAAHAAFLSGQQRAFYELLERKPELKLAGHRYSLVYGRLPAIEQGMAFAKGTNTAGQRAVLEGASLMQDWNDDEKTKLCYWAMELLEEPRDQVGGEAARALSHCEGAGFRRVLNKIANLWKASQLQQGHISAFNSVCNSMKKHEELGPLCDHIRQFMIDVSVDTKTRDVLRIEAMRVLAVSFEDEETAAMFKHLSEDPNPEVAYEAKRVFRDAQNKLMEMVQKMAISPPMDDGQQQ